MRINFVLISQCYQNFKAEKADFRKEIKALNPKKESLPLTVGGTSGESNIANSWKDHFSAIANSVGSADNRDQIMNALRTVPGHNDVNNLHQIEERIVRGLKNNNEMKVYKFASERLLTMMSIFLSGCMLTGKLPNEYSYARSDHPTI